MTLYGFILIVHVIATFILFAALATEALALYHLRRASTVAEAQPWFTPWPGLLVYVALSGITILLTGIALVVHEGDGEQAWARVAAIALVLTVPIGAASGRRMRRIRALEHAEMITRLRDPLLKRSISIRIALFLGIFVLVSIKPGVWGAVGTILVAAAIGLIATFGGFRRSQSSITETTRHVSAQRTGN
jgi:uncharacterized membrane protein